MTIELKHIYDMIEYLRNQGKLEWKEELQNLHTRWSEAFERVRKLEAEILRLKERDKYDFDENSGYWRVEHGERIDGPFCPTCSDGHGRTCRLHSSGYPYRYCQVCKNNFPFNA